MEPLLNMVYPCYNPKEGWEKKLADSHRQLVLAMPGTCSVRMVLVNDGSSKGVNTEHVHYLRSRFPDMLYIANPVNSGKGFALRSAISKLDSGLIVYTDVDQPYTLGNILAMFAALSSSTCNVAVGVRDASYFRRLPFSRLLLSYTLRSANYLFFPTLVTKDTQAGLKGFDQQGKAVFLKTRINGFLFEIEFLRLCAREKLGIRTIPLQLNEGVAFTPVYGKVLWREIRNFFRLLR